MILIFPLFHFRRPSAGSTAYCRLCLARDNLVEMSPNLLQHSPSSDDETSATQAVRLTELIFECTDVRVSNRSNHSRKKRIRASGVLEKMDDRRRAAEE